jgi:hypothetical protein
MNETGLDSKGTDHRRGRVGELSRSRRVDEITAITESVSVISSTYVRTSLISVLCNHATGTTS